MAPRKRRQTNKLEVTGEGIWIPMWMLRKSLEVMLAAIAFTGLQGNNRRHHPQLSAPTRTEAQCE